ncbi:uncharacterized protein PAC_07454 [Phialocephala subalpina]|uniref:Uncharacterized protein n=1 Tax=Phialocephala subalpina TaxID=576137 RepID=A0A1L7WXU5_9HELO|nr:uncharacterized protein PAC_07454 [Phialocephala subalpina]
MTARDLESMERWQIQMDLNPNVWDYYKILGWGGAIQWDYHEDGRVSTKQSDGGWDGNRRLRHILPTLLANNTGKAPLAFSSASAFTSISPHNYVFTIVRLLSDSTIALPRSQRDYKRSSLVKMSLPIETSNQELEGTTLQQPNCSLLSLPLELRNIAFEHLLNLPHTILIYPKSKEHSILTPLFLVCHQLRPELTSYMRTSGISKNKNIVISSFFGTFNRKVTNFTAIVACEIRAIYFRYPPDAIDYRRMKELESYQNGIDRDPGELDSYESFTDITVQWRWVFDGYACFIQEVLGG